MKLFVCPTVSLRPLPAGSEASSEAGPVISAGLRVRNPVHGSRRSARFGWQPNRCAAAGGVLAFVVERKDAARP
jgi:hypothetical protein